MKKILIIDDDNEVLEVTKETLSMHGFDVYYAMDTKSGIIKAKSEKPDLIILDVMMPGDMDGYDVCEKLKSDPDTCSIPIIILTARDMGDDVETAMSKKADWFIAKPYDADYLIRQVNKLILKRKQ